MEIGVISDTHGRLRAEAVSALQGCGLVLHAGDVCGPHVVEELSAMVAPCFAVRGNCDEDLRLPERLIRLEAGVWDLLDGKKRRVAEFAGSYVFREPRRMVEMSAQRIDELGLHLQRGLENTWRHRKQMAVALLQRWMALRPERKVAECALRLKGAMGRLRALGPEETLRRGYTLVQSPDGKLIRGVTAAKKQGELVVRFSDGKLPVAVKKG